MDRTEAAAREQLPSKAFVQFRDTVHLDIGHASRVPQRDSGPTGHPRQAHRQDEHPRGLATSAWLGRVVAIRWAISG
jgi:hypothetical protein